MRRPWSALDRMGCLLACSLPACQSLSHCPGSFQPCSELEVFLCHCVLSWVFVYRDMFPKALAHSSLEVCSQHVLWVGSPSGQKADVEITGSQWQLQIEENVLRDGAMALRGWGGEEMHREAGLSPSVYGPYPGEGPAQAWGQPHLQLFSADAFGCEMSNLLWIQMKQNLPLSPTPSCPRQEKFSRLLLVASAWYRVPTEWCLQCTALTLDRASGYSV